MIASSTRLGALLALAALLVFSGCPGKEEDPVVCGDGEVGEGEICDGTALGDATCASQGLGAGTLACNATCKGYVTAGCCGDGVVGGSEVCDGAALGGQTCQSRGFGAGELSCNATCDALVTSGCCGDGVKGGAEECDGTDVGGATCQTQGLGEGTLSCTSSCTLALTACCGDGTIGGDEVCDSTQVGTETCTGRGFRSGTVGCNATCGGYDVSGCCGDGDVGGAEACDDGNAVDGDSCNNACSQSTAVGGVRVCRNLPALATGVCTATAGTTAAKLITGDILLEGELLQGGQVLIDAAGKIACVGCNCEANAAGAAQIVCPDGAVSPGLINSHDHITYNHDVPAADTGERFEHRHDWRRGVRGHLAVKYASASSGAARVQYSELRFVLGGATSAVSAGQAPGFLRNLDYDTALEGLAAGEVNSPTFPLGDSGDTLRYGSCDYGNITTEATVDAAMAFQAHVAEGIDREARNEFLCLSTSWWDTTPTTGTLGTSRDLVGGKSAFVHGVGLKIEDYAEMAQDGTSLIWSPRSNVSLYGDTAMVTAAANLGVNIALGTDWIISGSMNVNRELACAMELNAQRYGGFFTSEDLWRMVTVNAARAAERETEIGRLVTGLWGDVAIFDARVNGGYDAVIKAEPKDVSLVLRGGRVLSGDAEVVQALESGCDTLTVCGSSKRVCSTAQTGTSLAALTSAANQPYALFACGVPENEPSCFPERPAHHRTRFTHYTGEITTTDDDGDGVADAADNCPAIFNPWRPVDGLVQGDHDADGVGDACDPCPLGGGSGACVAFSDADVDLDGFANDVDNCPVIRNADQADGDSDQKGDVCDFCPSEPNAGAAPCTASVYAVKQWVFPFGHTVKLTDLLVTAETSNGFFLQLDPADGRFDTADHSGVFVFSSTALATVKPGDRVSLASATVDQYRGQTQLGNVGTVTVSASDLALPAPVIATAAEMTTGGTRAEALESVLVRVEGVAVTAVNASGFDFTVTDGLVVDDDVFRVDPLPSVGTQYASITGVLMHRSDVKRLEPRSAADLVVAPAFGGRYDAEAGVCRQLIAAR